MTIKNDERTIRVRHWAKYNTLNISYTDENGDRQKAWVGFVEHDIDELNGVITGTSEELQETIQLTFEYKLEL